MTSVDVLQISSIHANSYFHIMSATDRDYLIVSYAVDIQEHVHYHISAPVVRKDFLVVGNDYID